VARFAWRLYKEHGTVGMLREKFKQRTVRMRVPMPAQGQTNRSSDETSVMEAERRVAYSAMNLDN